MEGTRAGTQKKRNRELCRMEEGEEGVESMISTSGGANQDNGEGTKIWEPRIRVHGKGSSDPAPFLPSPPPSYYNFFKKTSTLYTYRIVCFLYCGI